MLQMYKTSQQNTRTSKYFCFILFYKYNNNAAEEGDTCVSLELGFQHINTLPFYC